ncbi:MAG: DegT/DnrJ/EryC1/StrS family aminotransferase, partial [Planctomycetota bacterium]
MADQIPLSYPDITDAEVNAVSRVLRSGRLSLGPELEAFESAVARRAGCSHGVGVSSGTAGLHLALLALGVGPGDEVITPAFSFIASANCIEYVGAKPVFVDCDPRTLNLKASDIEPHINERTKAVIGTEVFGNPAGIAEVASLCNRHEIPLIEDCCEGLGSRLRGRSVGSFGRIGIFSFYPNKQITTAEGGVIVTDDERIANLCRSLRNQGRAVPGDTPTDDDDIESAELGSWLAHELLGYNYRLSELHAALGVVQMRRIDQLIEERQRVAECYTRRLGGNPDLILPTVEPNILMSWFVYVVRLTDRFTLDDRDYIIEGLRRHDVGSTNYFPPVPLQPYYARKYGHRPGDFPATESVSHRTVALP